MSERILVVDDVRLFRWTLREALVVAGYEVEEAESVTTGRAAARAGHFDAALIDFRLPDGDGLTLMKEIREHQRGRRGSQFGIALVLIDESKRAALGAARIVLRNGGEAEIRTLERVAPSTAFELVQCMHNTPIRKDLQERNCAPSEPVRRNGPLTGRLTRPPKGGPGEPRRRAW